MKRVYQIRDEQIKFKESERQAEIEESQEERNRILHDVTSFKQSEVQRQNGMFIRLIEFTKILGIRCSKLLLLINSYSPNFPVQNRHQEISNQSLIPR